MKALGLIETRGLLSAVVALDNMLKAANVQLKSKSYVGEGLVEISVEGGVEAVKTSVSCAVGAIKDKGTLVSYYVIPRAYDDVELMFENSSDISKIEGIRTLATGIVKSIKDTKILTPNEINQKEHNVERNERNEQNEQNVQKEQDFDKTQQKELEKSEKKEAKKIEKIKKETDNNETQTFNRQSLSAFTTSKLRALCKKLSVNTGNKNINSMGKEELIEALLIKINKK